MKKTVLFCAILTGLIIGLVLTLLIPNKCNKQIIFNDGDSVKCRSYHSSPNGLTNIDCCDGNSMIVSTQRIKEIKRKEQ